MKYECELHRPGKNSTTYQLMCFSVLREVKRWTLRMYYAGIKMVPYVARDGETYMVMLPGGGDATIWQVCYQESHENGRHGPLRFVYV